LLSDSNGNPISGDRAAEILNQAGSLGALMAAGLIADQFEAGNTGNINSTKFIVMLFLSVPSVVIDTTTTTSTTTPMSTVSVTATPNFTEENNDGLSAGTIAGIIIGVLLAVTVVAIIVIIIVYINSKRGSKNIENG